MCQGVSPPLAISPLVGIDTRPSQGCPPPPLSIKLVPEGSPLDPFIHPREKIHLHLQLAPENNCKRNRYYFALGYAILNEKCEVS